MKLSLSRMLFLIGILFIVLLLACVLLLGGIFGKTASDNDLELRRTLLQNSAAQVSYELGDVEEFLRTLAIRDTVIRFGEGSALDKFLIADELRNTFNDFVQFTDSIVHVRLRLTGGQTLGSNTYSGEFIPEYSAYASLVQAMDLDHFAAGAARSAVLKTDDGALLAVAVPVENKMRKRLGAMVVICSVDILAARLIEESPYLIECDGEILYASDEELVDAWNPGADTVTLADGVYSILSEPIRETDWNLISACRPLPWFDFTLSGNGVLLIFLLATAMIALALKMIHRKIVEPIENLALQIDSVAASDDFVTNRYSDRNELTRLAQGINEMNSRIRHLNEDVLHKTQQLYRMKLVQMSERILLLQSQLNPHFLYNNLECIRGMACLNDVNGVRDMTVHMAKIYRYCIRGGSATVGEEIDCARSYLSIIELRYGPVYSVSFDIEPGIGERTCPRMLLQPLIENSVLHGFVREKRLEGCVSVRACSRDGMLCFVVEDDGVGMEESRIRSMNEEFAESVSEDCDGWNHRVGLYNVNYRLKLIGRPGSGLRLECGSGGGLRTVLLLAGNG